MDLGIFSLFVLGNIQYIQADVAIKDSIIILYPAETFFNSWIFFELERDCAETTRYNVRTFKKTEILKEINRGDLKMNYTITGGRDSTGENEVDICLTDTENDVKGGFVYVIRDFLGLEQKCPQTVGSKKQRYITRTVDNMHYPSRGSSIFKFKGDIYSIEGPIVTVNIIAKPQTVQSVINAYRWPGL